MGILVKLFQKRGGSWADPRTVEEKIEPGMADWLQHAGYPGNCVSKTPRLKNAAYLYDDEERRLLRDINLSLIIVKMTFQLAEDRHLATGMVARNLQPFVVLDLEKPRREYLRKLANVARTESTNFATRAGFESFEALGRRWQRSGKDLYDRTLHLGPMGEQIDNKLQHILRKYARAAKVPYLTIVTRLPAEPLRVESPRFQVERPFILGGIPCASFEDARVLAQALAPAIARDEKEGLIEHYTSHYLE